MCLAIPARVVAVDAASEMATVAVGNVKKSVCTALLEEVNIGDYVLVHVGYALQRLSVPEAERTLALFAEAGLSPDSDGVLS